MHLRDGLQTHSTVRQRYDHLVETGAIDARSGAARGSSPRSTG